VLKARDPVVCQAKMYIRKPLKVKRSHFITNLTGLLDLILVTLVAAMIILVNHVNPPHHYWFDSPAWALVMNHFLGSVVNLTPAPSNAGGSMFFCQFSPLAGRSPF
jgi:hypothetical protein